jgi:hypothetical protein
LEPADSRYFSKALTCNKGILLVLLITFVWPFSQLRFPALALSGESNSQKFSHTTAAHSFFTAIYSIFLYLRDGRTSVCKCRRLKGHPGWYTLPFSSFSLPHNLLVSFPQSHCPTRNIIFFLFPNFIPFSEDMFYLTLPLPKLREGCEKGLSGQSNVQNENSSQHQCLILPARPQ